MVCPDCAQPVCCDAVVLGLTPEPQHVAEIGTVRISPVGDTGTWWHLRGNTPGIPDTLPHFP